MGAGYANVKDETGPPFLDNILARPRRTSPSSTRRSSTRAREAQQRAGVRDPPPGAGVEGRRGPARLAATRRRSGCGRRRTTRASGGCAPSRPTRELERLRRSRRPALRRRGPRLGTARPRRRRRRAPARSPRPAAARREHLQVDRDGLLDLVERQRRDAEEGAEVGEPAVRGDQAARAGDDPRLDREVVLRPAAGRSIGWTRGVARRPLLVVVDAAGRSTSSTTSTSSASRSITCARRTRGSPASRAGTR